MRTGLMRLLVAAGLLIGLVGQVAAAPILNVYPSLAPNGFGSPSFDGWRDNAIVGLKNGGASVGNPASPTHYSTVNQVSPSNLIVTNFPSWLGQANPGTTFGPAFANELGNRLHFGLAIDGNGTSFSLAQLNFEMNSSDPNNDLAFTGAFDGTDVYSLDRVGYVSSTNTFITSGSASQVVDALWYRGVGNSYEVLSTDPGATDQERLDNGAAYISGLAPFTVTTRYWLTTGEGGTGTEISSGSASVLVTPEPVSLITWSAALGVSALVLARRRGRNESVAA